MHWLLVTANIVPSSPILVTLMMEELHPSKTSVLTPHGVASQNMAFFKFTGGSNTWYPVKPSFCVLGAAAVADAAVTTAYLFWWFIQEVKCQYIYLKSKELQYNICQVTSLNFWDGIFQHRVKFLKIYIHHLNVYGTANNLIFPFLFLCNYLSLVYNF
jgi:hypothetical protein